MNSALHKDKYELHVTDSQLYGKPRQQQE